MDQLDYLKRQVQDLFKKEIESGVFPVSPASSFPSSTLYYETKTLSSEQLRDQFNSQLQDVLQLQYWLEDILQNADGLTAQLLKFVEQIYYTAKYQVSQKRQSDILRFMPSIEDLQVLAPRYYYYTRGYLDLTDQLVKVPEDGQQVFIAGLELPSGVGQMYQDSAGVFKILYGGVCDSDEYDAKFVFPNQVELDRLYVLEKLGTSTILDATGLKDIHKVGAVWVLDFDGRPRDKAVVRFKQHVLSPYLVSPELAQILKLPQNSVTGVPVLGQLDAQACIGSNYSGEQVYRTYDEYKIVLNVRDYEFSDGNLVVKDHVIYEPIILQR